MILKSLGKNWEKLLFCYLVLYFVGFAIKIILNYGDFQWDFTTFYYAAKAFLSGANPYDPGVLSSLSSNVTFPWVHPPFLLWFFVPFTFVSYHAAFCIFLLFKCAVCVGLICLWKNGFLKKEADVLFYLFCLAAFNRTILLDLQAGNISLIEQALLWMGFLFYLERRQALFCVFILLAACFKLAPALFLILLLFSKEPRRYLYFFGSAFFALAYIAIQYMTMPRLFAGFLNNFSSIIFSEGGSIAPSTAALIKDSLSSLKNTVFPVACPVVPLMVKWTFFYIFVALAGIFVVFITLKAWGRLRRVDTEDSRKMLLFFVCLTYAVIHPRMKDYSYILLIVPTYFIMKRPRYAKIYPLLFVVAIISSMQLPLIDGIYFVTDQYYSLVIAYGAMGLYLYDIFSCGHDKVLKGNKDG